MKCGRISCIPYSADFTLTRTISSTSSSVSCETGRVMPRPALFTQTSTRRNCPRPFSASSALSVRNPRSLGHRDRVRGAARRRTLQLDLERQALPVAEDRREREWLAGTLEQHGHVARVRVAVHLHVVP